MDIKFKKIIAAGFGLAAGYCAEQIMKEMVKTSVSSSSSLKEKIIKTVGGAIVIAAVAKVASDYVEETTEQVIDGAETVKTVVEDIKDGKSINEVLENILEEDDENGRSIEGTDNEESRGDSAEQPSVEDTSTR